MKDETGNLVILDFYEATHDIHARFYCPPGYRVLEALNELIIRKETVEFVTADDAAAGRGFGNDPNYKKPPVVEKVPVRVDIELKDYRLTGKIHEAQKKNLEETLAEYKSFLPLTDVTILRDAIVLAEKPFAAVNQSFITSIKESEQAGGTQPDSSL